jgi:hypothetical protein
MTAPTTPLSQPTTVLTQGGNITYKGGIPSSSYNYIDNCFPYLMVISGNNILSGTNTVASGGSLTVASGGNITVNSGGTLTCSSGSTVSLNTVEIVGNSGSLQAGDPSKIQFNNNAYQITRMFPLLCGGAYLNGWTADTTWYSPPPSIQTNGKVMYFPIPVVDTNTLTSVAIHYSVTHPSARTPVFPITFTVFSSDTSGNYTTIGTPAICTNYNTSSGQVATITTNVQINKVTTTYWLGIQDEYGSGAVGYNQFVCGTTVTTLVSYASLTNFIF